MSNWLVSGVQNPPWLVTEALKQRSTVETPHPETVPEADWAPATAASLRVAALLIAAGSIVPVIALGTTGAIPVLCIALLTGWAVSTWNGTRAGASLSALATMKVLSVLLAVLRAISIAVVVPMLGDLGRYPWYVHLALLFDCAAVLVFTATAKAAHSVQRRCRA